MLKLNYRYLLIVCIFSLHSCTPSVAPVEPAKPKGPDTAANTPVVKGPQPNTNNGGLVEQPQAIPLHNAKLFVAYDKNETPVPFMVGTPVTSEYYPTATTMFISGEKKIVGTIGGAFAGAVSLGMDKIIFAVRKNKYCNFTTFSPTEKIDLLAKQAQCPQVSEKQTSKQDLYFYRLSLLHYENKAPELIGIYRVQNKMVTLQKMSLENYGGSPFLLVGLKTQVGAQQELSIGLWDVKIQRVSENSTYIYKRKTFAKNGTLVVARAKQAELTSLSAPSFNNIIFSYNITKAGQKSKTNGLPVLQQETYTATYSLVDKKPILKKAQLNRHRYLDVTVAFKDDNHEIVNYKSGTQIVDYRYGTGDGFYVKYRDIIEFSTPFRMKDSQFSQIVDVKTYVPNPKNWHLKETWIGVTLLRENNVQGELGELAVVCQNLVEGKPQNCSRSRIKEETGIHNISLTVNQLTVENKIPALQGTDFQVVYTPAGATEIWYIGLQLEGHELANQPQPNQRTTYLVRYQMPKI